MTMPLKAIEILLIPIEINLFISNKRKERTLIVDRIISNKKVIYVFCCTFLISVPIVETVKNINSYINQGNYYSDVNVLSYPYISIFNKDKLYEYRSKSMHETIIIKKEVK